MRLTVVISLTMLLLPVEWIRLLETRIVVHRNLDHWISCISGQTRDRSAFFCLFACGELSRGEVNRALLVGCSSSGSEPHANRIAKWQVVIKRSDNICLFGSATLACPLGAMLSLLRWQALAAVSLLQLFKIETSCETLSLGVTLADVCWNKTQKKSFR